MPLFVELDAITPGSIPMAEQGAITVREACRRGGTQTKKRYGDGFYDSIGKGASETTKQRRGPQFCDKLGRKGGQTMKKPIEQARRATKRGRQRGVATLDWVAVRAARCPCVRRRRRLRASWRQSARDHAAPRDPDCTIARRAIASLSTCAAPPPGARHR